jgi:hypothetical protein
MMDPPTVKISVFDCRPDLDGDLFLNIEQSRAVMNASPATRVSVAQGFEQRMKHVGAQVDIDGDLGLTVKLTFVEGDGLETTVMNETPSAIRGFAWWTQSGIFSLMEDELKKWMASFTGHHGGAFYIVIKDQVGRVFRVEFMDVSWDSQANNLQGYQYELVY